MVLWTAVVEVADYVVVVVDDDVEVAFFCISFLQCHGNQLYKPQRFWLTAHEYIYMLYLCKCRFATSDKLTWFDFES